MADDGGTIYYHGTGNPVGRGLVIHKATGYFKIRLCRRAFGDPAQTCEDWKRVTCKWCLKRQPQEVKA